MKCQSVTDIGIRHLMEGSLKLSCSSETNVRALILYHNFMRCVDGWEYERSMVAACAIHLSSRINGCPVDIDSLIRVFFCMVNKTSHILDHNDRAFISLKKTLISLDYIMQRMLEFNLGHRLAHEYLVPFITIVCERTLAASRLHLPLFTICTKLLNDFYLDRSCLNYLAEHIAMGCIEAGLDIFALKDDLAISSCWYEGFCKGLTSEKLQEVKRIFINMYKEGNYETIELE